MWCVSGGHRLAQADIHPLYLDAPYLLQKKSEGTQGTCRRYRFGFSPQRIVQGIQTNRTMYDLQLAAEGKKPSSVGS